MSSWPVNSTHCADTQIMPNDVQLEPFSGKVRQLGYFSPVQFTCNVAPGINDLVNLMHNIFAV